MKTFRLRASPAVLAVATIPMWLTLMDLTILNVGYDNIIASLGATLDEVSWASTAYTLAGITALPLNGWIVARFGRKRVFLIMLALFTIGSVLCAFATSATQLALFRLLQGVGGGLLGVIAQAVFLDAYPDEERSEAINLLSVTVMVAPIAGPLLAGFVLERFDWPFLFLINVPLGVLTFWLAANLDIDQKVPKPAAAFSTSTIALLFGTLFAFQFVLQNGQRLDWLDSSAIRWALTAGIVLGIALIAQQMRLAHPMIDLGLFRNREFFIGNVLSVFAGGGNLAIAFLGPLFLQQILGFSPMQTGLMMIPSTIGLFIGNRFQDWACRRIALYAVLSFGMAVLALALWYNGVYSDLNTFDSITWLRVIQGFAFGVFMIPIGILSLKTVPREDIDSASGLNALIRQVSGMAAIALTADLIEKYNDVFLRRLLSATPRWPVHMHAPVATPNLLATLLHQATVLAYQHVYAISAVAMLLCAVGIAGYGVCEWLLRRSAIALPAAALPTPEA